jgi:hypothetical protein
MQDDIKLKEEICDSLCGRKQNIEKIITLFFGYKDRRKSRVKKFNRIYKSMNKNLNKMTDDKLNEIASNLEATSIFKILNSKL